MPDPALDAAPPPSPTAAELLATHGTLRRGAHGRFYAPRGFDSAPEDVILAAIADGSALASQRGADGRPIAVTAAAARAAVLEN